jgi:hypothetical protein
MQIFPQLPMCLFSKSFHIIKEYTCLHRRVGHQMQKIVRNAYVLFLVSDAIDFKAQKMSRKEKYNCYL